MNFPVQFRIRVILWAAGMITLLASCQPAEITPALMPSQVFAQTSVPEPASTASPASWAVYTHPEYKFSIEYPAGWQVLETPTDLYPTQTEEIWFYPSAPPLPQTGARADVVLMLLEDDPTPGWAPEFFDDYRAEPFRMGNLAAQIIRGTNKESLYDETAVIARLGDLYLLALTYPDPASQAVFEHMLASLRYSGPQSGSETSQAPDNSEGVINPQNAASVTRLAQLGNGVVYGPPAVSPDGRTLAIPSSTGVDLFDIHSREFLRTIGTQDLPLEMLMPVLFTPNGTQLVTVNYEYELLFTLEGQMVSREAPVPVFTLWDVQSGEKVHILRGIAESAHQFELSPDGILLAAGLRTGEVILWDLASGELLNQAAGYAAAFSPDGNWLVTTPWVMNHEPVIRLYRLPALEQVRQWEGQRAVFAPDGTLAVENSGAVRLMDIESGRALLALSGEHPVFSEDGSQLALLTGGSVVVYRTVNGEKLYTLGENYLVVDDLLFAPDGQSLAAALQTCRYGDSCAFNESVYSLWQLDDSGGSQVWETYLYGPWLSFSVDGAYLLQAWGESVESINVDTGQAEGGFGNYSADIGGLAFSPDGQQIAISSGGSLDTAKVWSLPERQVIHHLPNISGNYAYRDILFLPDGRTVLIQDSFWSLDGGNTFAGLEAQMKARSLNFAPASTALTMDGAWLAVGYADGFIDVWDLATGELLRTIDEPGGSVDGLAFSPDGKIIAAAVGYPVYQVMTFQLEDGKPMLSIPGKEWSHMFSQVAFSPDGELLATLAENADGMDLGVVEVWRVSDGERLYELPASGILSLAYSPVENILATGGYDRTLRLWDASNGSSLGVLGRHSDAITDLAFTSDGRRLASGSGDGTVMVWGLPGR